MKKKLVQECVFGRASIIQMCVFMSRSIKASEEIFSAGFKRTADKQSKKATVVWGMW